MLSFIIIAQMSKHYSTTGIITCTCNFVKAKIYNFVFDSGYSCHLCPMHSISEAEKSNVFPGRIMGILEICHSGQTILVKRFDLFNKC